MPARAIVVALLPLLLVSCGPSGPAWLGQVLSYSEKSDRSGREWDAITASAAADPAHIQVLLDRAEAAAAPEQLRLAEFLGALGHHAVTNTRTPPAEYLTIAESLERSPSPDVRAAVANAYKYFPLELVAGRLLPLASDDSQPALVRLNAIRSIRLSKHHWSDSPHPETLGPSLRALVDGSPDTQIVLAALWAEAQLGTLDAATLDAALPRLIAADPSLARDGRVEAIRDLITK